MNQHNSNVGADIIRPRKIAAFYAIFCKKKDFALNEPKKDENVSNSGAKRYGNYFLSARQIKNNL